jgi:ribosomal protein S27E
MSEWEWAGSSLMSSDKRHNRLLERVRQWVNRWADRVAEPAPESEPDAVSSYPDYVTCPHCAEPEVEVWSHDETVRCHNCGRVFNPSDD